jgi:ABC-type uncharacterized transport system substrate-binding protein
MGNYAQLRDRLERASAAFCALYLAGCATVPPPAPVEPPPPVAVVEPAPPAPSIAPPPSKPSPPRPEIVRAEIVLVVDPGAPSHGAVAAEIEAALPPRLYRVVQIASDATAELEALRDRPVTVVAVGASAVAAARTQLPGKPLVFCQVLAYEDLLDGGESIWGVPSLPPLALQLTTWKAIDPTLRTVALIVSDASAALAAEAQQAARDSATDLVVEASSSDRETMYLFRRLAAGVDGLWLLPDNEALSPTALRDLLSYALARGIGVLTFNDALLRRGALLSATSVPADVAATVTRVVERVVAGRTADLPAMTPLSAAEFEINQSVATTLGLAPIAISRWVTREPD